MATILDLITFLIAVTQFALASDEIPAIPKCCPVGMIMTFKGCALNGIALNLVFADKTPKEYKLFLAKECEHGRYRVEPEVDDKPFLLFSNGSMKERENEYKYKEYKPDQYCIDTFQEANGTLQVLPLICFSAVDNTDGFAVLLPFYTVGSITSIIFLVLTMGIYMSADGLRTVYGRILFRYWLWQTIAYASIIFLQWEGWSMLPGGGACEVTGFFTMFVFLVSFFWLNIYCFHTWRTMKGNYGANNKERDQKTMFWYNIYGLVTPFCILTICVTMHLIPSTAPISHHLRPKVGERMCWIEDGFPIFLYFLGPISILVGANTVFFFLTAVHLVNDQNPTMDITPVPMKHHIKGKKKLQVFLLCLVLFFAMGINWILEIITHIVDHYTAYTKNGSILMNLLDIFNLFYGVIVFLVFVVFDHRVRELTLGKLRFLRHHRIQEQDDTLVPTPLPAEGALV